MTFGLRLITTILITLLLAVSHQRNLISSRWPKPPVRLPVLALLIWVGTALPFLEKIISKQASLTTIGQLALLYATLSLGGWLLLEIPGALGWWHPPAKILRQLSGLILAAILTLIILQQAGVNLAGLITTSALLTGVVAFAAQEPLKDIFGGLSLQLDQPFKEGDWIQIGEDCGQVIMLTLMNTYLRTGMDGCTLIIPNDTVAQATIRRVHLGSPYGNCFEVGLDYGFPPSQALSLLLGVVNRHASVLTKPAPKAWVASFEDSYICYGIQVWHRDISDVKRLSIRGELMEQIWYALERIGQSIPFRVRLGSPKPQTLAADDPMCADSQRIGQWHIEQYAYLLNKLKSFKEGDSTVLDNSMILFGSGLRDGNRHSPHNLPLILGGTAGGRINTGQHLVYDKDTPLSNLYCSILDAFGAPVERFADSTGKLKGILS